MRRLKCSCPIYGAMDFVAQTFRSANIGRTKVLRYLAGPINRATTILLLALILIPAGLKAAPATGAYKEAHECYEDLRGDPNAQKLRENWEKCITQFEGVAKKYGRSVEGADAKFSLGRLFEELAQNSKNQMDWNRAVKEYHAFAGQYPRNSMADDAYLSAAKIEWERFQDKEAAKKDLIKIIKFYKNGDQAGEAKKYLDMVEKGTVPEPVKKDEPVKETTKKDVRPEERFTIVIDPGHGGSDTGAIGPSGTEEKDITLKLSKRLAAQIQREMKQAGVLLTRSSDKTLTLDDRVKFANDHHADFFVSVHANASTSKKQHGVQTYYLNNASDDAAARLAAQENKNIGRKLNDLDQIISTMIQNASTEESRELARLVHKSLVAGLSKKYSGVADQNVRSALFYVLVGVKCPSILVETSYVSNPKEEKRLNDAKYQAAVADSIADGLKQYVKMKKAMAGNI